MKICIVCSNLAHGGAERVAALWATGFANRGYSVMIITNLREPNNYLHNDNIILRQLFSNSKSRWIRWLSSVFLIRKELKAFSPDVIISVVYSCSIVSRVASIGMHIPIVATEHGTFERPNSAPFSLFNKIAKFYINNIYDCVTILTKADKQIIGNKVKNVYVLSNPLSLTPLSKTINRKNIIFAVGRLNDWHYKGFDVLIRAWARVVSSLEFLVSTGGWKLQIAGTGSEGSLKYLKQLCKENGVEDSVEFLGFRKDVEKLYQDASIFVLSSRYEGFGLVLIEAMSQGCACVACDYKGRQREILNPTQDQPSETRNLKPETQNLPVEACENGILCEPDNVEALAAGIQKMITDDEYREGVRKNAIERSKYYSIENTLNRWEVVFHKINRE